MNLCMSNAREITYHIYIYIYVSTRDESIFPSWFAPSTSHHFYPTGPPIYRPSITRFEDDRRLWLLYSPQRWTGTRIPKNLSAISQRALLDNSTSPRIRLCPPSSGIAPCRSSSFLLLSIFADTALTPILSTYFFFTNDTRNKNVEVDETPSPFSSARTKGIRSKYDFSDAREQLSFFLFSSSVLLAIRNFSKNYIIIEL